MVPASNISIIKAITTRDLHLEKRIPDRNGPFRDVTIGKSRRVQEEVFVYRAFDDPAV